MSKKKIEVKQKKQQKIENQNIKLTQELKKTLDKYIQQQNRTTFLSGYLICKIDILPTNLNIKIIKGIINMIKDAVQSKFINQINYIQILIQSALYMKNYNTLNYQQFCIKFQKIVNQLINQGSTDQLYFRKKWEKCVPIKKQYNQKNNGKYHQQIDNETQQLIRKLQQQQYQRLEKQKKQREENQNKGLQCIICSKQIPYNNLGIFESCQHSFHLTCFTTFVKTLINDQNNQGCCPQKKCQKKLSLRDIQQNVNQQLKKQYDDMIKKKKQQKKIIINDQNNQQDQDQNKQTGNLSWCPNPYCQITFIKDDKKSDYQCPNCDEHFCLNCRCRYHQKIKCIDYQQFHGNNKIQQFKIGAKFKQCPQCQLWVQKKQNQKQMTCQCGQQFCYHCGGVNCTKDFCLNQ